MKDEGGRMKNSRKEFSSFIPHPSEERRTTMETEKKLQAKKRWEQPQLLVLMRSNPEEAVLTACKIAAQPGSSETAAGNCIVYKLGCANDCTVRVGS
jgi:hypothetical protein